MKTKYDFRISTISKTIFFIFQKIQTNSNIFFLIKNFPYFQQEKSHNRT